MRLVCEGTDEKDVYHKVTFNYYKEACPVCGNALVPETKLQALLRMLG